MRKLQRYISNTVLSSILLVLAILLGLYFVSAVIDEMGQLSDRYDFIAALRFGIFSVPGNVFDLLPFSVLVGCLAGLGTLASNSELIVMRCAGVSTARIIWMVMRPTIVVMAVGFLVVEYIAPSTESIAQSERAIALRSSESIVNRAGLWHREGNKFMHFNVVQPNGILHGVSIYSFDDDRRLVESLYAERAIYQSSHWILEDYSVSYLNSEEIRSNSGLTQIWETNLSPGILNILVLDPIDLSIAGLWQYSNYLQDEGLNNARYRLAFWRKILQPLSTMSLVIVAIAFIFGPLREVTMGFRIFIGVLVGIVFSTAQDLLSPASIVYGFEPIYASLIPIVLCLLVGTWFLRRA